MGGRRTGDLDPLPEFLDRVPGFALLLVTDPVGAFQGPDPVGETRDRRVITVLLFSEHAHVQDTGAQKG